MRPGHTGPADTALLTDQLGLGGPYSWFGHFGEEKNLSLCRKWKEDRPLVESRSTVTVPTVL